jgi:hypothetical protein
MIYQMFYSTFRLQFLPKKKAVENAIRAHFPGVASKGPISDVIAGWWIPAVVQSRCVGSAEDVSLANGACCSVRSEEPEPQLCFQRGTGWAVCSRGEVFHETIVLEHVLSHYWV